MEILSKVVEKGKAVPILMVIKGVDTAMKEYGKQQQQARKEAGKRKQQRMRKVRKWATRWH
ncbi:hypothetical protein CH330_09145 [candidate division WOR-3 bacterium JGI_Cruoil_03_51_56]|uniref:Uncharacterized protein n=1 Tax=candidate division WOR-3 bacterium JGI_Cruoil_03_51_56 TaxID=1973747 RepID=A0A235BRI5_UNCW3|nr:MAG: hypothetical protein CH330_09145 [candidate division WOR-3 bacterium JGI_Cruoil_03_51_56]